MSAHCRIGRVRMKDGGADVRVLPGSPTGERAQLLMRHARILATQTDAIAGFVVIAWDRDGAYQVGFDASGSDNPIPRTLLPTWVAEVLRREAVTTQQIHDVLERDYVVTPPSAPGA